MDLNSGLNLLLECSYFLDNFEPSWSCVIKNGYLNIQVFFGNNTGYVPRIFNNNVSSNPAGIYLHKNSNKNTRTKCEVGSNFTIKTPELH